MTQHLDNKDIRNKIQKIIVIRTDRIGDVILSLPTVDVLKKELPDKRIDLLVNEKLMGLVSDYPNIVKVHSIEKESLSSMLRILRRENYDLAIVLRPLFIIALSLYVARVKYRLGSGFRWYSFLFNLPHYQHRKDSLKHELEYNIDVLTEIGIKVAHYPSPAIYVSDNTITDVRNKLKLRGIDIKNKFIIVHPFSLGSALTWGINNFTKLLRLCIGDPEFKHGIILTGNQLETSSISRLIAEAGNSRSVYSICNFNLKELAGLIKLSDIFVANSTGPIHIAAAVGTYVIGFYSPLTVQSQGRWSPYTDKKKIFVASEVKNQEHSPFMNSIKPEEVYQFLKTYLSSKA